MPRCIARIVATARALKSELGVGRGDRVAILAANHSDYLVLLYACARLGAMLVTLNWRLAIPEQLFILSDSGAKVLVVDKEFSGVVAQLATALPDIKVVGLDYSPDGLVSFDELLAAGSGDGRNPHTDTSNPLLLVYTSGTTGRPKGAVLRQEALIWNARDEPARARHALGRSHPDRAADVPCRRPQYPDHAGACSSARP